MKLLIIIRLFAFALLSTIVEAKSRLALYSGEFAKLKDCYGYVNMPRRRGVKSRGERCNSRLHFRRSALLLHRRPFILRHRGGSDVIIENEDDATDEDSMDGNKNEDYGDVDDNDVETDSDVLGDYTDEYEEEEIDYESDDDDNKKEKVVKNLMEKVSATEHDHFVEPYFISPSLQIYTTASTILLSRKFDMLNPKVVRVIRFSFVLLLCIQQAFIFYIRIMAKRRNDTRHVELKSSLKNIVQSQIDSGGGNDMLNYFASSFFKKETTVKEYDISQTSAMQGTILFNMLFMWFLHFKMQQIQPLLMSIVNGLLQLVYNPLFQVYVIGRNLERPFKSPEIFKPPVAIYTDDLPHNDKDIDGSPDPEVSIADEKVKPMENEEGADDQGTYSSQQADTDEEEGYDFDTDIDDE